MQTNLDELKVAVEKDLPTILAGPFHRCRTLASDDIGSRLKCLLDLAELVTKFACIVSLQELRTSTPDFAKQLSGGKKTLDVLRLPSFGHWTGLFRELSKLELGDDSADWLEEIKSQWTLKNNQVKPVLRELAETIGRPQMAQMPPTAGSLCEVLVTARNTNAHKAVHPQKFIAPVEAAVSSMLSALLPVFRKMLVFQPTKIEITKTAFYTAHVTNLRGTTPEQNQKYELETRLEIEDIYLTDIDRTKTPITLTPFVLYRLGDSGDQPEPYVYNEAWSSSLVYDSHTSGRTYHHKELHRGFDDLVKLTLKPGFEADPHVNKSVEERSQAADEFLKRAKASQGKGHIEDALLEFEESAGYERRSETFYQMAVVYLELEDPEAAISRLRTSLELDPDNQKAISLIESLEAEPKSAGEYLSSEFEKDLQGSFPSLFHILTPKKWFDYSTFWCVGALAFWYLPSMAIEYQVGTPGSALAIGGFFLCCILHVLGFIGTRARLLQARPALLLQLNESDTRFYRFFDESMLSTLGRWSELRRERYFFIGWFVWGISIPTISVAITSSDLPSPLIAKRWFDFALLNSLMFYQARGIVGLTRMIWLYSRRSLKPFLSRVADAGLAAFGPVVTYPVLLVPLWWFSFWLALSYLIKVDHWIDVFMLAMSTALTMIWSIGLPVALYRSAQASKYRAASKYSFHMQDAFSSFINEPDESRLKHYQWLVDQQKVIKKTPVWPLSWYQTFVVVILSNVALFVIDAFYIAARLDTDLRGLWQSFFSG